MADKQDKDKDQTPAPDQPTAPDQAPDQVSEAATPQAPVYSDLRAFTPQVIYPTHLDETQPGGRYIVNGRTVDAEGREV